MRRTLKMNRPVMLVDIEERHYDRPIAEALAALGYSGFAYTPDGLKSLAMFDAAKHFDARNYQKT